MRVVEAYIDGSCLGNPGPGGYGIVLIDTNTLNKKSFVGHSPNTTNQEMELTATIKAIESLKIPCQINIYSDSNYVIKGITEWIHIWKNNQWKNSSKSLISHYELWKKLNDLVYESHHTVLFHKVKAHSGIEYNELADKLAKEGAMNNISKNGKYI